MTSTDITALAAPGALAILGGHSKFLGKRIFYHFSDMLVQKHSATSNIAVPSTW